MVDRKFGLGVFVCVFNKDFSKIMLIKRNEEKRKKHGADWGNVGGKVEFGEILLEACLREAREEIGVSLSPEKVILIEVRETPFLTDVFHALHFVYATVLDENEKITINEESDGYQWFELKNLPEKMIDKKEYIIDVAKKAKKIFGNDYEQDRSNLPFRKNAEGFLIFGDNIICRDTKYGYIDFPGGGVEDNEDMKNALKREALEEAGAILDEDLKEVANIKAIWPADLERNEKQQKRFKKYQGDDVHLFVGKVSKLIDPKGDGEENGWDVNERMMPIKKAIEIMEGYKPFPKESKKYNELKLKILRGFNKIM